MLITGVFFIVASSSTGLCNEEGRLIPDGVTQEAYAPLDLSSDPPICEESNDDFSLTRLPIPQSQDPFHFDIPIVVNSRVEGFILYFQTVIRERFSTWLAQSSKYAPLMRSVLQENGLPEDLVYLSLIESGFNPYAYSRSKAVGLWQFIAPTGKRYGLKVNAWVDERRDPEKSTLAAALYLKDLYDMFECWYLAAAGYNAGEGKIARGMKRYRTEDFWELTKYRYLKRETKDYVPQMIAAALIAKNPEGYGFEDIAYEEPLCYDKVMVPEATDLRSIAKACEVSVEELRDLNPELLRVYTPPDVSNYEVKIPCGKKEIFLANFETLQQARGLQFKTHVTRRGETLHSIAKLYRIELTSLLETNCLATQGRLASRTQLIVPVPLKQRERPTAPVKKAATAKPKRPKPSKSPAPPSKV
jgi:membrane-bound lytic murein transglycosylase D